MPVKKSEKTRKAILKSAVAFLWDHPFRDLTVAELMKGVGASRSTFYQYFRDLHDLMTALLDRVRIEIFTETETWFEGEGDPVANLKVALKGLVDVCFTNGPVLQAVADAAVLNADLENVWKNFLKTFDNAVAERIKERQAKGQIEPFPAYPVAVALNRLDAAMLIESFGRRPRAKRKAVLAALTRIWCSTLYGVSGK